MKKRNAYRVVSSSSSVSRDGRGGEVVAGDVAADEVADDARLDLDRANTIMSIFCGVFQRYPPTILRMTLSMSSSHGSPIGSANPLMSPETSSVPRRNRPSSLTRRPERLSRMLRWFSRSNGLYVEGRKRN